MFLIYVERQKSIFLLLLFIGGSSEQYLLHKIGPQIIEVFAVLGNSDWWGFCLKTRALEEIFLGGQQKD